MAKKKRILVAPLDWGLGHAARCVPIIKELVRLNHNVTIGANGNSLFFLKREFPHLPIITVPGYDITYGSTGSFIQLLLEATKFYAFIKKEHDQLERILKNHPFDLIISDNRYGLWNEKVKSILITHQLFVKTPFGQRLVHKKIKRLIKNFDECWIPDMKGKTNLSGDLSHLMTLDHPHRFIGPLSRFENSHSSVQCEYDVLAIISGPEPQRFIFEKLVFDQLRKSELKVVIVCGQPNGISEKRMDRVTVFSHLPTEELNTLILKSRVVVCRSGYSSIMDLIKLNKKAILVPTPGQTEQEYLALLHKERGNFVCQQQRDLNIDLGIKELALVSSNISSPLYREFDLAQLIKEQIA